MPVTFSVELTWTFPTQFLDSIGVAVNYFCNGIPSTLISPYELFLEKRIVLFKFIPFWKYRQILIYILNIAFVEAVELSCIKVRIHTQFYTYKINVLNDISGKKKWIEKDFTFLLSTEIHDITVNFNFQSLKFCNLILKLFCIRISYLFKVCDESHMKYTASSFISTRNNHYIYSWIKIMACVQIFLDFLSTVPY